MNNKPQIDLNQNINAIDLLVARPKEVWIICLMMSALIFLGTTMSSNQNIFLTQMTSKKELVDDKTLTLESFTKHELKNNSNHITDARIKGVLGRV